ncbi:MAG: GspH/FimT family pseudopilin [Burkholderiales bacterium]|nr:GspH/FimT family pseudopilin [Burkholderiales bacterium]
MARHAGFTAIELMVVVSIVAILAALAAPSFQPLIERWRVREAAENLTSTLYYARSEAIKRGGGITIDATGGWGQGWKVTHTQNGVTTDLQVNAAPNRVTLAQSNGKLLLYVDRWGMLSEANGGAPATMNVLLSPTGKSDTDISAIRLCIAGGGRIVQMKQGAACPA